MRIKLPGVMALMEVLNPVWAEVQKDAKVGLCTGPVTKAEIDKLIDNAAQDFAKRLRPLLYKANNLS